MRNEKIISEFEKLARQISNDISAKHGGSNETKINIFRLKQIENAIVFFKKYPHIIKSGKDLEHLKGIGKGIMRRVDEILSSGHLSEITNASLDEKYVSELKKIYGVGDVKARELVHQYGIRTISELKNAVLKKKIKLSNNILIGLKYAASPSGNGTYEQRIPRTEMKQMKELIATNAKNIEPKLKIKICGSYRRKKPFSNDIDCMITHPKLKTMRDIENGRNYLHDIIISLKKISFLVDSITSEHVKTKFMGFCQLNAKLPVRRIDIRYIPAESYYPALLYFTGSGSFNQNMRKYAKKHGFKLNEYGLYRLNTNKTYQLISVKSEKDIFAKLGIPYVPPEERN